MNRLDQIFSHSQDPEAFADAYARRLIDMLGELDRRAVARFINVLLSARSAGRRIFFCGNGGSAATASHFANDIAIGTRSLRQPFKAIALTDNNAVLTAIANDDGYDVVFVRQLEVLLEPGDVVVAISASGNSVNVVKALELARSRGNPTVALTGFSGGRIAELADTVIHIVSDKGEYGPVEDMHMIIDHLVGSYLIRVVRQETPSAEL